VARASAARQSLSVISSVANRSDALEGLFRRSEREDSDSLSRTVDAAAKEKDLANPGQPARTPRVMIAKLLDVAELCGPAEKSLIDGRALDLAIRAAAIAGHSLRRRVHQMSRFLQWRNGANTGCIAPLPSLMNHQHCPLEPVQLRLIWLLVTVETASFFRAAGAEPLPPGE